MEVQIAGRHVEITDQMDGHIREQVEKLPPFAEKAQYVSVTLAVDSGNQVAEIIARSGRTDFVAQATTHDMYQSIDEAFNKMERRITRKHDRLVNNRSRAAQQASEVEKRPEQILRETQ